jgi:hypothetical protein
LRAAIAGGSCAEGEGLTCADAGLKARAGAVAAAVARNRRRENMRRL